MKGRNVQMGIFLVIFLSLNSAFASKVKTVVYQITNSKGRVTPMYANPTIHSERVTNIPANGKGIKSSSRKIKYGSRYWQKISWNLKVGWVFADRLKYDPR
jgi:hypothetical protein